MPSIWLGWLSGGPSGIAGSRTLVNLPMHHAVGPAFTRPGTGDRGQLFLRRHFDAEQTLRSSDSTASPTGTPCPRWLRRILNLPAEVRARYHTSSLQFLQIGGARPARSSRSVSWGCRRELPHESYGWQQAA